VPVIIRSDYDDDKTKLEVAIIENLQREDLNPVDRAIAFARLANEFGFKHVQIAEKVGKSREYVSNTIRLLALPADMQQALSDGKIAEGHTRPLLMLTERPEEQNTLFREIMLKRLTVRDTESIARRIATDRVRKKEYMYKPEILEMERELSSALGTRVIIEPKDNGGKLTIDFLGEEDLRALFARMASNVNSSQHFPSEKVPAYRQAGSESSSQPQAADEAKPFAQNVPAPSNPALSDASALADEPAMIDDRSKEEIRQDEEEAFDPSNFSI
jgi:hypothetical protein